jgi:hypothetical protein
MNPLSYHRVDLLTAPIYVHGVTCEAVGAL